MSRRSGVCAIAISLYLLLPFLLSAQASKPGLLTAQELKRAVPTNYFFDGQVAPAQLRNAGGFRVAGGKLVLAALVDTSGYATDITEKFQGLLITEVKLHVADSELAPGAYGFGFNKQGKFVVMNVAADEALSVAAQTDDKLAHPVPLKIAEEGGAYRLYAGKKWVALSAE
ncbi:MAG TPA: hypothetical protein VMT28_14350 [Terriglobales bacterium]|nr:hypothetical protein [Terriglobales bacterium]